MENWFLYCPFSVAATALFLFRLTKSRRTFYAQIECLCFHTASTLCGHSHQISAPANRFLEREAGDFNNPVDARSSGARSPDRARAHRRAERVLVGSLRLERGGRGDRPRLRVRNALSCGRLLGGGRVEAGDACPCQDMPMLPRLDQCVIECVRGGGEICRGEQFELLVESVHREHVLVDIRGKIGGRTRPTIANIAIRVDDLLTESASSYTRILGKLGGRRRNVVHAPVRKTKGVEGYHDKTRRTAWDALPG